MKGAAVQTLRDVRFETRDPDEFESRISDFTAGPARIDALRTRFRGRARAWRLPHFSLFQVGMEGGRVVAPARPRVVCLTLGLDGSFEARAPRRATFERGDCHVVDDTEDLDLAIPSTSVLVVNADADLLEETALRLADAAWPAIREPRLSLAAPEGARFWRRLASFWRDLRAQGPCMRSGPGMTEAECALAEALVVAVRGNGAGPGAGCGGAQLRRVEEFIVARLADPLSRADLCTVAGVSERSLSRAFARRHGVGPMTFLKQLRLDTAQRALLAADPAERSVTEVGIRCGLFHLGRFSVEYRHKFGESPSETLRR